MASQSVTITVTARDGAGATSSKSIGVTLVDPPAAPQVIGYWAPATDWSTRLAVVGASGVKARRVYAQLSSAGTNQQAQIAAAIGAGMLPVVTYKPPKLSNNQPDLAGALAGAYDAYAQTTAAYLDSLGVPVAVGIWHEPEDDMSAAQFLALQRRLVPFFAAKPLLKVGVPFLHGWELDTTANRALFETYIADDLLANGSYDFFGIDSYQTGSQASPGSITPDQRIDPLLSILAARGAPNMPIAVGEYNAWTTAGIQAAGEKFLSTPQLWFACMFDDTQGVSLQLSGARLDAYKATKSDPRSQQ
jgi:hypothetical protein